MSKLAPFNQRRLERIARRWASVVFCGVLAAAICLLVDPAVRVVSGPLAERLASLPPKLLAILLTVFTAAGVFSAARGRLHGFLGLRRLPVYPPLWMSIVLGLAAWGCTCSWIWGSEWLNSVAEPLGWFAGETWPIICCGAVLLLSTLLAVEPRPDKSATRSCPLSGVTTIGEDFLALREWLRNDDEIRLPGQDRFNHDQVARRIVERLKQPPGDAQTTAVIGPLGSGKSTIGRLVEHHLRSEPGILFASISLWPFESAEAAVRGILQAVTNELGKRVNVLPLVGLPENYVGAIESAAGSLGWVARFLRGSSDPAGVLEQLSTIACAAGLRVVLWVEDLERFSGGDDGPEEPHRAREMERLQPIRSLLYLLNRTDCISVVVADTSLRSRFDLSKIVRFVEKPPVLDDEVICRGLALLRDNCLNGHPRPVIDPTPTDERLDLTVKRNETIRWLSAVQEWRYSVAEALCKVLNSPRRLKSALRLTLETWEKLPGEIDADCVLVASSIRVTEPTLFSMIEHHIILFKHGLRHPVSASSEEKVPHRVADQIDNLLAKDLEYGPALAALLSFLFPTYPPSKEASDGITEMQLLRRPQAFFGEKHSDYWRRYLMPDAPLNCGNDQVALKAIADWQSTESASLADWLLEPTKAEQLQTFGLRFASADHCRLLIEVVRPLRHMSAAEWDEENPALLSLWQMMVHNRPNETELAAAVESVMAETVSTNLPLAYSVFDHFVDPGPSGPQLTSSGDRARLRTTFHAALLNSFTGPTGPESLTKALREGSPYLLRSILCKLADGRERDTGQPFEGWPDLADSILRLAEQAPQIGVPLILPLFTDSERELRTETISGRTRTLRLPKATFRSERAMRLFERERLLRVVRDFVVTDALGAELKAQALLAKRVAQEELAEVPRRLDDGPHQ